MNEPHEFRLKLKKSHVKYKLKSLERYRKWFPPADVVFELQGLDSIYKTYVDKANRLKLDDILKQHPDMKPGDYLVFKPLSRGREWQVRVEHSEKPIQTTLAVEETIKPREKQKSFSHSALIDMLVEVADYFDMYPESEYSYEVHRYDVIWKRVKSGNPIKVFEVQVGGSLDSALTKLKHARDLWNSDVFLVVTSAKDAEKAEYLLSGSFHEIADKTAILKGREVYEMLVYKQRFGDIEKRMQR